MAEPQDEIKTLGVQIFETLQVNFKYCISGYITKETKLLEHNARNNISRRILWSKFKFYVILIYQNLRISTGTS